ncbi:hypothetical protein HYDPIDRAFT_33942 [Hydnomerulius pinastri MD-312]|uniref:Uncharacterized protein n=1 Tax=Hydnomerulius pinastri MD-312 TaxID=994086 RepID=A0A0C9VZ46_9AGAM|nr:hypothetical protein HYDPIDRAFT_33942 [Hydnomerulius pinastri MD-312]
MASVPPDLLVLAQCTLAQLQAGPGPSSHPDLTAHNAAVLRAGVHSSGATRSDINGLRAWHIINGAPWLGGLRLQYMLKVVENLTLASSRHPPRPPVMQDMLNLLCSSLDPSVPLLQLFVLWAPWPTGFNAVWGNCCPPPTLSIPLSFNLRFVTCGLVPPLASPACVTFPTLRLRKSRVKMSFLVLSVAPLTLLLLLMCRSL